MYISINQSLASQTGDVKLMHVARNAALLLRWWFSGPRISDGKEGGVELFCHPRCSMLAICMYVRRPTYGGRWGLGDG